MIDIHRKCECEGIECDINSYSHVFYVLSSSPYINRAIIYRWLLGSKVSTGASASDIRRGPNTDKVTSNDSIVSYLRTYFANRK